MALRAIQKTKNDLVADIGLDPSKTWVYYGGGKNYLTEAPVVEDDGHMEPSEESE